MSALKAEDARTPDDPRLTAYEAGRWYALHSRALPAGATRECRAGYNDVSAMYERLLILAEEYSLR